MTQKGSSTKVLLKSWPELQTTLIRPCIVLYEDLKHDLVRMVASHIDDFLHVGDPEFDKC